MKTFATGILALASLATTGSATATNYCVGTGNALAAALLEAAGNNGDDVIKIRQGVFTRTVDYKARWPYNPKISDLDNELIISGGWSVNDNCATQSINPALTVLDGELANSVLDFSFSGTSSTLAANIIVSNLTVANGRGDGGAPAANLGVWFKGVGSAALFVDNVIVRGADDIWGAAVAVTMLSGGSVTLRNMVIADNTTRGDQAPGGLKVETTGSAYSLISNNSIHDNHGADYGSGARVEGNSDWVNNVVAGNTSDMPGSHQVYSPNGAGVTVLNNHFETRNFVNGVFDDLHNTSGNPQWTLQGIFRVPLANSPLRDSGDNFPLSGLPTTDITGKARISGGTVDRGAIEYVSLTLFGSSFEN